MGQEVGNTNGNVAVTPRQIAPVDASKSVPRPRPGLCELWAELLRLNQLVEECEEQIRLGRTPRLPGNTSFLADGRVLCRERNRGDSRYPYGSDGFNLWVNASGYIHCNHGLYFLFLPAQEGEQPPIAFLTGTRTPGAFEYLPHSLLPVPFINDAEARIVERYTVIGHDATYFVTATAELLSVVRIFLAQTRPSHAHLHFSTLIANRTEQPLETYTSAYFNPFCRHQFDESSEDRWFKEVRVVGHERGELLRPTPQAMNSCELPAFLVTTNEDVSRFSSILNFALLRRSVGLHTVVSNIDPVSARNSHNFAPEIEHCTSQVGYFGSPRRNLATAAFLRTGSLPQSVNRTVFNDNAIIGDMLRIELPADSYLRTDYLLSLPENEDVVELESSRPISASMADVALRHVRRRAHRPGNLSLAFSGESWNGLNVEALNHFLPFLKKQVAVCANIHGYMQRSANSLIGFRDVLQAVEGHLLDNPTKARAKILEALSMVMIDGRCPRQYSLPTNGKPGKFDLREFVDQGVWAIATVHSYLSVTGDFALLKTPLGYLRRSGEVDGDCVPTDESDSVLDHLRRIIGYLERNREPESKLVLALYGDWNDALDGLGTSDDPQRQFGTGVSVMTSLQLLQSCRQMAEIAGHATADCADELQRYQQLGQEMRNGLLSFAVTRRGQLRRILHGWGDKHRYEVGGFHDSDETARDALTVNAFWVLADMLDVDPALRPNILAALHRLDSPYGYRTFWPGFGPDATGVGRINRLPIGSAENGAAYLHATAFAIAALFRMGEAEQAWQQVAKILPFAPHHKGLSHSPFVMPNSYVNNPELNLNGQSMNDWQTGSSNVLLKLVVAYVIGFQPGLERLRIAPASWMPFDGFTFCVEVHHRKLRICFRRGDVDSRQFVFNGTLIPQVLHEDSNGTSGISLSYAELSDDHVNLVEVIESFR